MERKYDLILWGATGFTGKLVAEYILQRYGIGDNNLKWAIAGRNLKKLQQLQLSLQKYNPNSNQIPIFVSDSEDLEGLRKIASTTKVLCSTVGPYNLLGKTVLEACFLENTNYTDLTGEPTFIKYSIDRYHNLAKDKGIRFVHSCGFDSIPSDIGTLLLQSTSKSILGAYCTDVLFVAGESKGSFSGGTIASLMGVLESSKDPSIRRILEDPYSLNPPNIRGNDSNDTFEVEYLDALQSWTAPFVMGPINTRVVRRSSALIYGYNSFRYNEVMEFGDGPLGWATANGIRLGLGSMILLSALPITKDVLQFLLPSSGDGPDENLREAGYFTVKLLGFLKEKNSKADIVVNIHGKRDPGYGATSRMIAEASIALAKGETSDQLGVITPASAFGLEILKRLDSVQIQFSVNS